MKLKLKHKKAFFVFILVIIYFIYEIPDFIIAPLILRPLVYPANSKITYEDASGCSNTAVCHRGKRIMYFTTVSTETIFNYGNQKLNKSGWIKGYGKNHEEGPVGIESFIEYKKKIFGREYLLLIEKIEKASLGHPELQNSVRLEVIY